MIWSVVHLDTDKEVDSQEITRSLSDPLRVVNHPTDSWSTPPPPDDLAGIPVSAEGSMTVTSRARTSPRQR